MDLDSRELRRGAEPVRLSPKAFHLLEILVANRPKALSKADLQDKLWPDTFVVEKNLANLVSEIRQVPRRQSVGIWLHPHGPAVRVCIPGKLSQGTTNRGLRDR